MNDLFMAHRQMSGIYKNSIIKLLSRAIDDEFIFNEPVEITFRGKIVMKVVSLFSGGGGLDLGFKNAGFEIERKKIDVPGLTIKSVGKYVVTVRLYESAVAEVTVEVVSQDGKAAEAEKKDAE